jgi:hypothetical protein
MRCAVRHLKHSFRRSGVNLRRGVKLGFSWEVESTEGAAGSGTTPAAKMISHHSRLVFGNGRDNLRKHVDNLNETLAETIGAEKGRTGLRKLIERTGPFTKRTRHRPALPSLGLIPMPSFLTPQTVEHHAQTPSRGPLDQSYKALNQRSPRPTNSTCSTRSSNDSRNGETHTCRRIRFQEGMCLSMLARSDRSSHRQSC